MSLDRAAEILTWRVAELDPVRLSLQMQVWARRLDDRRQGDAQWHARPQPPANATGRASLRNSPASSARAQYKRPGRPDRRRRQRDGTRKIRLAARTSEKFRGPPRKPRLILEKGRRQRQLGSRLCPVRRGEGQSALGHAPDRAKLVVAEHRPCGPPYSAIVWSNELGRLIRITLVSVVLCG